MAFTQSDLDNINRSIANGIRRTRLNGREVEYHSIEQMQLAKNEIIAELNRATSTIKRPKSFRSRTVKGL